MSDSNRFGGSCMVHGSSEVGAPAGRGGVTAGTGSEEEALSPVPDPPVGFSHSACPPEVHRTCFCVRFIAEHTRMLEDSTKVGRDIEKTGDPFYMNALVKSSLYALF